jgi:hypothetical protein
MISFEEIKYYMFNIIICEFLIYNDIKLLGWNYLFSYHIPKIELGGDKKYNTGLIKINKFDINWLKKWKYINVFFYNDCKEDCDFSNLNIKFLWIRSKSKTYKIKFPNNVERIFSLDNNILDISSLTNLKYLKNYEIMDCNFALYEKNYSNILFDKLVMNYNTYPYNPNPINIKVEIYLCAAIQFNCFKVRDICYKEFCKINHHNLYNVKYIILEDCELNKIHNDNFFTIFPKLEKLDLIHCNFYGFYMSEIEQEQKKIFIKNILSQNHNLNELNTNFIHLKSRKEILNFCN